MVSGQVVNGGIIYYEKEKLSNNEGRLAPD
jgi:hypothetical protein